MAEIKMASANSRVYVSLDELKQIANSLESQREQIYNTYNNKVKVVLQNTDKCFKVAGLKTADILNSFNTTFKSINDGLSGLVNVLNNNVIPQYNEIAIAIQQMFNRDFASQMTELLSLNGYLVKNNTIYTDTTK